MNEHSIKVEIDTKVRYEFNLEKFARYMANKICKEHDSFDDYDAIYNDCYSYPHSQSFNDKDVEYLLNNKILVRLEEDKIDSKHIDEYLYEIIE